MLNRPTTDAGKPECEKLVAKLEGCFATVPLKAEAEKELEARALQTLEGGAGTSAADCGQVLVA